MKVMFKLLVTCVYIHVLTVSTTRNSCVYTVMFDGDAYQSADLPLTVSLDPVQLLLVLMMS